MVAHAGENGAKAIANGKTYPVGEILVAEEPEPDASPVVKDTE